MSMYNLVHGINPFAGLLLAMLGNPEVGRFRDCYLNDKNEICVYTRLGGGNREYHEEDIETLRAVEGFLRDEDDDFDSTYATFYYKVPEEFAAPIEMMIALGAETKETPNDKWQRVLKAIEETPDSPEVQAIVKKMEPTLNQITEALKDG